MIIGMIGLVVLALFANIAYYEYLYKKPIKRDTDIMSGYKDMEKIRSKYGKRI